MSSSFPTQAFSWTRIAQAATFPNLEVGANRFLYEGLATLVRETGIDSTLHSPPDRHPILEINPELQETEERILERIRGVSNRPPHIALFAPGPSKIDPLYALHLMNRIQDRCGRTSRLTICERNFAPATSLYYEGLDWREHEVVCLLGSSGNLEKMKGLDADLILVFHPNMIYDVLHGALADNLVSGGLALWQEDFYRNQPASDLEDILSLLGEFFGPTFSLMQEPIGGPLVPTYFARILRSQTVTFLLQKR